MWMQGIPSPSVGRQTRSAYQYLSIKVKEWSCSMPGVKMVLFRELNLCSRPNQQLGTTTVKWTLRTSRNGFKKNFYQIYSQILLLSWIMQPITMSSKTSAQQLHLERLLYKNGYPGTTLLTPQTCLRLNFSNCAKEIRLHQCMWLIKFYKNMVTRHCDYHLIMPT